ncbi:hypothetical protein RUND412_002927 [Rhizina undulata]
MSSRTNRRRERELYLLLIQQDTGYPRASSPSPESHDELMVLNDEDEEAPNDAILLFADPLSESDMVFRKTLEVWEIVQEHCISKRAFDKLQLAFSEDKFIPNTYTSGKVLRLLGTILGLGYGGYPMCSYGDCAFTGDNSSLDVFDRKIEIKGGTDIPCSER